MADGYGEWERATAAEYQDDTWDKDGIDLKARNMDRCPIYGRATSTWLRSKREPLRGRRRRILHHKPDLLPSGRPSYQVREARLPDAHRCTYRRETQRDLHQASRHHCIRTSPCLSLNPHSKITNSFDDTCLRRCIHCVLAHMDRGHFDIFFAVESYRDMLFRVLRYVRRP